ncbi:MAG: heavy metal translocating P-type ATPase [Streptosporangiaceae bacterium]
MELDGVVPQHVELAVGGMTCASCAARVERELNGIDGVHAAVNFATETAAVDFDPDKATPDDLVDTVAATGYTAELTRPGGTGTEEDENDEAAALRRRLIIAIALAVPVALVAMIPPLHFPGWEWFTAVLATPVVAYAGLPFHRAALANARHAAATMDTLISLGTLAAYAWSLWALFAGGHLYFEVAAVVTALILLGRFFEARARKRAGGAVRALLELGAKDVAVLDANGEERRVPAERLRVGDRFVVRPGERVGTDGVVERGASAVDTSMLTGESVPVEVAPGSEVTGATVNAGGRLVVHATRVGADTAIAQIGRLVTEAQQGKAEVQRLADRVSAVFVPVVIVLAALTLAGWLLAGGGAAYALTAAVAVLVIACPCALGLATPTALMVGTGRGAQLGLLIRGPEILESTRRVDTVVLDKTGTVTTGEMTLHEVTAAGGIDAAKEVRLTGAVERGSEHPIARAIASAAADRYGPLPDVDGFASHQGQGVEGVVDGVGVLAGRTRLLADRGMDVPPELDGARRRTERAGLTAVLAGWDGRARVVLGVGDTVQPTSRETVRELVRLGLRPILLTGDNKTTAHAVAGQVGIADGDVVAEVMPEDKVAVVRRLQREGRVVAMAGDGVNDAAALAQADLGIALGTGTDVAIEASDLTLVRGDPRSIVDALRLSRRTLATIKGNLFWAFAYNVAAIPLAALGLLNPMIAGAAMAFSSVFVVTNSLRLRGFRPVRD